MQNIIKKNGKTKPKRRDRKTNLGKQGRWRTSKHVWLSSAEQITGMRASETKSGSNAQQRLDWICQLPKTHTRLCKSAAESDLHQRRQKEKETLGPRTASWLAREPVDVLSVLQRMIFQHLLHNITRDPARAYSSPGRPALPHRPSPCITPIKGAALCQPVHCLAPEPRLFGVEVIFTCSTFFLTQAADCRLPQRRFRVSLCSLFFPSSSARL